MEKNIYTCRHLARVVIEAKTPLAVGSGNKDIMSDALVSVDVNGLPYIPGTSLAGALRHALNIKPDDSSQMLFGFQKRKENHGSEVIISDAKLLNSKGIAVDGLADISADSTDMKDALLNHYLQLPIRQHVRLSHRGTAEDAGKFDEQVVFKGSRFCFSIEVWSESMDDASFKQLLEHLCNPEFRIGGGSRKGFGEISVESCKYKSLDLTVADHLEYYLNYSSDLSVEFDGEEFTKTGVEAKFRRLKLILQPDDFFFFSSGFGDDDADNISVKEDYVKWCKGNAEFVENGTLIPATSLKGALAHRVAFYANKAAGIYADKLDDVNSFAQTANSCVDSLFGCAGKNHNAISRGKVMFSDILQEPLPENNEKLMNHVTIDRFTGGAIDGHLFTERATYGKGIPFECTILVDKTVTDKTVEWKCLHNAINDLCGGLLPLGGGASKGYGIFTGKLYDENNNLICPTENYEL